MKNNSKKYEKYVVRVSYRNGNEEIVNFKGVHTSDYNSMLKVYRDFRDDKQEDANISTIDFCGVSSEGETNIFWTKRVSATSDSDLNKDCREVVRGIFDNVELLSKQLSYHSKIVNKYDKKIDTVKHMIESCKNNKFKTEDELMKFKINMFDELEKLSSERRFHKDQIADLRFINGHIKDVNIDILKGFIKDRKEFTLNSNEYKNNVELEMFYKDETQKNEYLLQHKSQYDVHVIDEANKSVYFYNHVGTGVAKTSKTSNQKQQATNSKLSKNSNRKVG